MIKLISKKIASQNRALLLIIILMLIICLFYIVRSKQELSRIGIEKMIRMEIIEHEKKEEREQIDKNRTRCNDSLTSFKRRWNNIIGVRYDEAEDICMVKYTLKSGETEEAPSDEMRDIN